MDDNTSGWNNASLDNVQENFNQNTQPNNNLILIKGKVEDTLLDEKNLPEKIAILKLDTNFYESFKIELEIFFSKELAKTSAFINMPLPPPKGVSSTVLCLSVA